MMSAKEDDFLLLLLLYSQQLPLTAAVLSNAQLKHFLGYIELKRRDCHIPRCALIQANQSPFQRLYHSKNDQSFITFTGLDYNAFEYLLHKFRPLYYRYSPYSVDGKLVILNNGGAPGGRPQSLDPAGCLGLGIILVERQWLIQHFPRSVARSLLSLERGSREKPV
jgi:hypothetical protein